MKNNKKGLSTIVATLLIILLTLVAVGIIWIVVRNVIQGGADQVNIDSMCLAANVEATRVQNVSQDGDPIASLTNYSVTIYRNGGEDPIAGVKLVFTERDGSENEIEDWALAGTGINAPLDALAARSAYFDVDLVDPTKISVVVYFEDSSGNEQLCSTANQYTYR